MTGIYKTPKIYESDAVGSIYNGGSSELSYVIGGRRYRCVEIGGKIWMAENLDFKFDGCSIGSTNWSSSSPSAAYYNDDEATYGIDGARKCGVLYNWFATKYLEDNKSTLIPGWHVPTRDELNTLNYVGNEPGTMLKALDYSVASGTWPTNWNGTDDYGFGFLPAGFYTGTFVQLNNYGAVWSCTSYTETHAWRRRFGKTSEIVRDTFSKTSGLSVRLIKD